ncbi:hypothetical protein KJ660_01090 [Candidatus Micrarchaeota archaeon]|nr:hypothetical protein [Candidatus Micrarchaeota archaeon]
MTYGWALVVIIVIIAVLYILVGTPTSNSCGNFSTLIPVVTHKVNSDANLSIRISNGTGGAMNNYRLYTEGTIGSITVAQTYADGDSGTGFSALTAGDQNNMVFTPLGDSAFTGASGQSYRLSFNLTYTDQYGSSRSHSSTCTGTV